jgi:hypothetical protein
VEVATLVQTMNHFFIATAKLELGSIVSSRRKSGTSERSMIGTATRSSESYQIQTAPAFEIHYSIADLAKQPRLGRETARLLEKDESGVLKIRLPKATTRCTGVPESVDREEAT